MSELRQRPILLVVGFAMVYCLLYALFYMSRGGPVERLVIDRATVAPAAHFARVLEPGTQARPVGNRIDSPRGSLIVQSGCEGIETLFLLWAAIAVFPASLRAKLPAMLWGTVLVYGLNQVRLVGLFLASHHSKPLFGILHGYVAPTAIILLVGIYFLWWTAKEGTRHAAPAGF